MGGSAAAKNFACATVEGGFLSGNQGFDDRISAVVVERYGFDAVS